MGKGLDKSSSDKIINWEEQEVAPGKRNARSARPKDKLEFKFFFKSWASAPVQSWSPTIERFRDGIESLWVLLSFLSWDLKPGVLEISLRLD